MFKPFGFILGTIGMFAGAWLGYRFAGGKGAAIGFFAGGMVTFMVEVLAFPYLLNEGEIARREGMGISQLVKSFSGLFFIAAGIFVVFTPASLRGVNLGYADPFTPFALGFGGLFAIVRLKQRHPFTECRTGEKIFGFPMGLLWLLSIFAAFMWYSDPVAKSVGKVQAGKYAEAIAILDDVIEQNRNNAMAYQNRAYAKLRSGRAADAIEDYTHLIQLEPQNPTGYLMRGIARKINGEDPQADFDTYMKLKPEGKERIEKAENEIKEKLLKAN
ncbi:MAG: hypothetical protein Q8P24_20315 [Desulfobacterales bacterium]|nr:hypothetical protein [Desulfobacterales bacterium]